MERWLCLLCYDYCYYYYYYCYHYYYYYHYYYDPWIYSLMWIFVRELRYKKNDFLYSKKESERSKKCRGSKINNLKSFLIDYSRFEPNSVVQIHFCVNIREHSHCLGMVNIEWKKIYIHSLSSNFLWNYSYSR